MLEAYRAHAAERAAQGIPPLPLSADQVSELIELLKSPPAGEEDFLLDLLTERVPPGVDDAAYVKAAFLADVAKGEASSPLVDKARAVELLGTMLGGYNIMPLVDLLDDDELAAAAAAELKDTLLMFDAFHDVAEKAKNGNAHAQAVMQSWADAEWFEKRKPLADAIKLTVFKVAGETNTDDLSPAQDAWSRPDIPLHSLAMLKNPREGITNAIEQIEALKNSGNPVAYVGDVVGTGSSRKSATNSVLWTMGDDIPFVPNKRQGGVVLGSKIAPIFFNTLEDSGALPIEVSVDEIAMGDTIVVKPYEGRIENEAGDLISEFELKTDVILDEVRAGGRIPLIIGRSLTERARESLGLGPTDAFRRPEDPTQSDKGFTLAQKIVGRACGLAEGQGVRPGTYCEPRMGTVGSQDTTGPMTRDELKELACLGFSADLVMQSFCHTAAYPKPVDIETQHTLPDFIQNRGGVALRPGDGIIHSWLNRMLLPDQVGTGGDSHTRFPLGISFPAGSGLVAFGAALGVIPLDMPESVLVRFTGEDAAGHHPARSGERHSLRGAAAWSADGREERQEERLQRPHPGNSGPAEDLTVEQAFELSDASAERSAGGCTINLSEDSVAEYLRSNVVMLRWMIASGYGDARTLERRAQAMEEWLAAPSLLRADDDAEYAEVIEINMSDIKEPLLACPNDPDDVKPLSEVAGTKIDEVFIGSCMTNIGHFRAAGKLLQAADSVIPTRLWIAPPTKMDEHQLMEEGYYNIYAQAGARTEMPGCSLCMGNQARIQAGSTCVSTSTRNFPNRLGQGSNVFLASAELAAVASVMGKLPTPEEYLAYATQIDSMAPEIYNYLNFDQVPEFLEAAEQGRSLAKEIVVQG